MISQIKKRDGRIVDFDQSKITDAIWRATLATGGKDRQGAERLSDMVVSSIESGLKAGEMPSVEQIGDFVEKVLVENGQYNVVKSYILYRALHSNIREMIDSYLTKGTWLIKENSNTTYSLQSLNSYLSSQVVSEYWLHKIYKDEPEIKEAHKSGDFHVHNLSILGPYCVGWDMNDLLMSGFNGVRGKVTSKPAKHFRAALGQVVNFLYTLQGEAAGAQAFSNFDTYLAPFIRHDGLDYKAVKQALQEFMFNMNVPTRVGFQTPFTNITLDLQVPKFMANEPVIIGGQITSDVYGDFQKEMDLFNTALAEVMVEGDGLGRVFTFPIPTINITKDFDWDNPVNLKVFETSAKYGIPYFSNFVNSDMNPDDVRSMCCRLRLDKRELNKRGGGLFGSNPLTGSIGVVTINLPRIGYLSKNEGEFFGRLDKLLQLAKSSFVIKRRWLEDLTDLGLYPYSKFYLRNIKAAYGKYWKNHFNTVGILGMNEAALNFMGKSLDTKDGLAFADRVLNHIRDRMQEFQEETGEIFNLEATPAEGAAYRMAKLDKERYPEIIVANNDRVKAGHEPYYTNSSHFAVNYSDDIWETLRLQDPLQTKYTGGTVVHIWLGESRPSAKSVMSVVKKVTSQFKLPYFTLTPSFSVCQTHGYLSGEHFSCTKCEAEGKSSQCEVYSRVVGYLRPVEQWNAGKREEFSQRKMFDRSLINANISVA
ncbi:MAG: ribonucleoside triphosphate reductase [Candidatus Marsarchaeota archaeon]|nr:ribonucleoside triphosphate reductase [Candidatus Marsarchaeota archaeon]